MNNLKGILFAIIIALPMACNSSKEAVNTQAQETEVSPRSQRPPRGGGAGNSERQAAMQQLVTELGLNEEQQTQLQAIQQKYRGQMQAIREENQGDFQAMRSSMMELRANQNEEIKTILTDEQFAKFEKWQEENRPQRGGRQGRG